MSEAGQHQYIEQNKADNLQIRLLNDALEDVTLVGAQSVQILAPGGAVLLAFTSAGVTISGNVATLSQAWPEATYGRNHGYKAEWTLTDGATTFERVQYFSIVRRKFRSVLTDADITAIHPYIIQQNQAASLSLYKQEAWQEITAICRSRIPASERFKQPPIKRDWTGPGRVDDYPGNFFYPAEFRTAHLYLTLSWFFDHNSFGNADQNEARALKYRERGLESLDLALSRVSFDRSDDGVEDTWEEDYAFSSLRIGR
tara:strand:+ start:623 stop:1393 length:771 start_codon:yes stop_codon:yes gene_type:complete